MQYYNFAMTRLKFKSLFTDNVSLQYAANLTAEKRIIESVSSICEVDQRRNSFEPVLFNKHVALVQGLN